MSKKPILRAILAIASPALLTPPLLAADLFVDASLATGNDDGSSWADAFQGSYGLASALAVASAGDRVFVAQGTYYPTDDGDPMIPFVLAEGVRIYGGCVGGETTPEERPPIGSAPTVLSGDLNGDDPVSIDDNSNQVLTSTTTSPDTVLDGCTITGGFARDLPVFQGGGAVFDLSARPTIRSCEFVENLSTSGGGAVLVRSNSSPTFIDCRFVENLTGGSGGAVFALMARDVRFDRCWFERNQGVQGGAVALLLTADTLITSSVFVENVASGSAGGGAIALFGPDTGGEIFGCTITANRSLVAAGGGLTTSAPMALDVRSSILWGNFGPLSTRNYASQVGMLPDTSISYSIVERIGGGAGNLSLDPEFVDAAGGDLRLRLSSPGIDAGDNASALVGDPTLPPVDLAGFRRRQDEPTVPDTGLGTAPIVDIGAYEFTSQIGRPYCAGAPNSTGAVAQIDATGSPVVADDSVTLTVVRMPLNSTGVFLTSTTSDHVPAMGAVVGPLCLGGAIGRFLEPGQVQNSGGAGEISIALDLGSHPTPTGFVAVQPGETWRFQAWFRDTSLGFVVSNYSDAVAVTFE